MPLIRCPRCEQAYDVPGVVAVRLPNSIAACACGEWLSGSKAALLARMLDTTKIQEIDLAPYRVAAAPQAPPPKSAAEESAPSLPRSVRVIARGSGESVDTVFTIAEHPLWIGRKGCHVELSEAELSIRHCSIRQRGGRLFVRDADSYTGTFLDGQPITEAELGDGTHLLRIGAALVSVETTDAAGQPVEPIQLSEEALLDDTAIRRRMKTEARERDPFDVQQPVLVCVEGGLAGQEFLIPPTGLTVGREGDVRVPDEYLSRRHFEVVIDEHGDVRVRDLGSRNGTFLNTLPARDTRVHAGDEIRAGVNRFRVEIR